MACQNVARMYQIGQTYYVGKELLNSSVRVKKFCGQGVLNRKDAKISFLMRQAKVQAKVSFVKICFKISTGKAQKLVSKAKLCKHQKVFAVN